MVCAVILHHYQGRIGCAVHWVCRHQIAAGGLCYDTRRHIASANYTFA